MHVEPRELVAVHSPDVGESGRKGSTGFLERSGIGPKRNNPIALSNEFVCFCGKPDPVGGERLEDMVRTACGLRQAPR